MTIFTVNGIAYNTDDFKNFGYVTKLPALISDSISQFTVNLSAAASSAAAALVSQIAAASSAAAAAGSATAAAGSATAAATTGAAQVALATTQAGNAATSAINAAAVLNATAADSIAITAGTKAFTIGTGKSFFANEWVIATADASDYLIGQVVSYTGVTLTISVPAAGLFGAGTFTSWTIGPSGSAGSATARKENAQTSGYGVLLSDANKYLSNRGAVASVTYTLPSGASAEGLTLFFNKVNANSVVIQASGGEYIMDSTAGGTLTNNVSTETTSSIGLMSVRVDVSTWKWVFTGGFGSWTTA